MIYVVPGVVDQFSTVRSTVSWSPPSQPNGIITGYQVIYFVYENRTATEMMSATLSNTTMQYSIQNLGRLNLNTMLRELLLCINNSQMQVLLIKWWL